MQRIFLIGIKGAGMSALARILQAQGHDVSGSDITDYVFTEDGLLAQGITVLPFQTRNFDVAYDVIIRGNAFNKENNIEVAYLDATGIETVSYYDFLNQFLTQYTSFAITGTHGKTTTTGLVAKVFEDDQVAYLIGDGTGVAVPEAAYFIFESCEYKRHFLAYTPDYAVITNIEYDHPDYFVDLDDVIDAFSHMVSQTKKKIVAFGDDQAIRRVMAAHKRERFITYGFDPECDYVIENYVANAAGITFTLTCRGEKLYDFSFPFYGLHMVLNVLPAIIIGLLEGKSAAFIEAKLQTYAGVKRRFNIESLREYVIIDDYAHHPSEIAVTLGAVKQRYPDKKIVAIFQPHTFTRTAALAADFITALAATDVLYLTDIFASAREAGSEPKPRIILDAMPEAQHLSVDNVADLTVHNDSVFVFMGAGDVQKYINAFKNYIMEES
jgi:UDP-N-acetylmuramate--alanine ligase